MKKIKRYNLFILFLTIITIILPNKALWAEDSSSNIVEMNRESYENNSYEGPNNKKLRVFIELEGDTLISFGEDYNKLHNKKREIEDDQSNFKENIINKSMNIEFLDSYKNLVNGFSSIIDMEDMDYIRYNPLVKEIHILNEIERPSIEGKALDERYLKNFNLENENIGKGSVISIIDTGFEPYHETMRITEGLEVGLLEKDINTFKLNDNLRGKYFSEKIPYGYNYFDNNSEIRDLGLSTEHGIHVSGIALANGDDFKGQAPEAQLLAMKVFSNNPSFPSTFEDIYIKAIEDSILLGADVINLSLGTPSGFNFENSLLSKVIERAKENGITCVTSAGNTGHISYGRGNPYFHNPDISTIGSLSVIPSSFSVGASFIDEITGNIRMADFSSWGTGPLLEMKPEIVAPGVDVLSTLKDNRYGTMSGTSMAAPYISGNMANIKSHIIDKNIIKNEDKKAIVSLSKVIAMNTGDILFDEKNIPYSPRLQGAGSMNIDKALNFSTTVLDRDTKEGKVELGEFNISNFSLDLELKNYTQDNIEYETKVYTLVNQREEVDMEISYNLLKGKELNNLTINGPDKVTVYSNSSRNVDFHIDFGDYIDEYGDPLSKNQFVEGFVVFTPTNEKYSEISIPYVGFYGDWFGENSPKIFDGMDKFNEVSFYRNSGLIDNNEDYLGYIPNQGYYKSEERIAISPGTSSSIQSVLPVLSYLRNAEEVRFNILDKNGRVLKRLATDKFIRKNYFEMGRNKTSKVNLYSRWDGKINEKYVKDGVYYYQIEGKLQDSSIWQEKKYPIIIDTKSPEIRDLKYEDGKIQWTGLDENSGLSHFLIYVDGEDILGKNKVYAGNAVKEGNFNYNYNGSLSKNIKVVAVDCAGNISEELLLIGDDINSPEVYIIKPEIFDIFNKNQVLIEGYAIDESEIERISINGENVDFKYDNSNGRYEFNHILRDLEDGVQKIIISAMDKWENSIEYKFIIYIDTSKPDLEMENRIIYKYLPKGGRTIITGHEAYNMDYLKTLPNMEDLLLREDTLIKLSKDVFINRNGHTVPTDSLPELIYFYDENHIGIYDEKDGKIKFVSMKIKVGDNLGVFKVYVNGSEYYTYDEGKLLDLKPIFKEIDLDIPIYGDMDEIIIEVIDMAGNLMKKTILINHGL